MRINLAIIILLLSKISLLAQSGSVYTRYGIGDFEFGYSAKMNSIGDLGVTQLDPDHILVTNPASWTSLVRTRIEFGFGYKGDLISDSDQSSFTSETDFKGFTIGFPVSRDYGIGVVAGLVPFSRVSYETLEKNLSTEPNYPSYSVLYEGKGGLSKLFLGSSVYLPFGISAGITLDYYFGNQNYFSTISFEDSIVNIDALYENNRRITGYGTTIGLISPNLAKDFHIGFFDDFKLGFSFKYLDKLDVDTIFTSTSLFFVDTVAFDNGSEMKIPSRFNFGISFVLAESYNFNVDYMFQPMSKYKFNNKSETNLQDISKLSAAMEFRPKKSVGMTMLEQMIWRVGASYEQTQFRFYGNGIDQYSLFAGFSYPLGIDNSLDFAVQYSNRGTKENNLLNEQTIRLTLGLSFGELWFLTYEK